jgi:ribosomal protein S18 acetylase RimI-like enzyme
VTEIRLARAEEYDRVGALTLDAYRVDGYVSDSSYYATVLADAGGRARTADLLVAVDGERIAGTVTYCPPGSSLREIGRPDEGEFRMLAVSPDSRGRGVGEALVRHVVDLAAGAGLTGVVLLTGPRMAQAHRLYGKLGFARLPERDWSPPNEPGLVLQAWRAAV